MERKIIIGYDGSPESSDALAWAVREAASRSCHLEIVTCYRIPVATDMYAGWAPAEASIGLADAATQLASRAADEIAVTHPDLQVVTRVSPDGPAETLLSAVSTGADMVVVGASSHRGSAAFWLGSTPRAVVRRARCPVVVVRGGSSPDGPVRVVVGIDGSEQSMAALRWAAAEADRYEVTMVVVHAWEYPYETPDEASSQARDMTCVDAARVLDAAVEQGRELCGGDVRGELLEGAPAAAIVTALGEHDLLVLGSRGRGALRSGLFGSTVNNVLDRAVVPVAVIHGDEGR